MIAFDFQTASIFVTLMLLPSIVYLICNGKHRLVPFIIAIGFILSTFLSDLVVPIFVLIMTAASAVIFYGAYKLFYNE